MYSENDDEDDEDEDEDDEDEVVHFGCRALCSLFD